MQVVSHFLDSRNGTPVPSVHDGNMYPDDGKPNNKKRGVKMSLTAIGAAIAAFTGIGAGIGIGLATAKATDAVARQPEADGKIMKMLVLGCALAEATAIYGLVVAVMIIFLS